MSVKKVLAGPVGGFLAGGIIGGTIALLLAPKPGKELRKDIADKTNDVLAEGKRQGEKILLNAKHQTERVMEGAGKVWSNGKKKLNGEFEKVGSALKAGVSSFKESAETTVQEMTDTARDVAEDVTTGTGKSNGKGRSSSESSDRTHR